MKYQLENGYLEYDRSGTGNPILFIHGYPLSRKIWETQAEDLSSSAEVITLDLRGHGGSFPFPGSYPMELLAEDCYQLLSSLNIKNQVFVCGLSMGGYVTFALYRIHPELFKGMILTSTRAAADSQEGKANRDAGVTNVKDRGVGFITDGMLPKTVSPKTLSSNPTLVERIRGIMMETSVNGVIGALQGMRDRPDSTALLSQIACPVLVVHGADDQIIPVAEAETMAGRIHNSRMVVIPDAGHLVNMEQPRLFNQAVREFTISNS